MTATDLPSLSYDVIMIFNRFSPKLSQEIGKLEVEINLRLYIKCGPGSVVGIATDYGLDGPGIESRWGEIFRKSPDRPWAQASLL